MAGPELDSDDLQADRMELTKAVAPPLTRGLFGTAWAPNPPLVWISSSGIL